MDAFDADALIYAATPAHPLGIRVRRLFAVAANTTAGVGSVLLIPELLIKPVRLDAPAELGQLNRLLTHLQLLPADESTVDVAVELGARYGLRAVDAVHLATAVVAGADRFITNNRRDFGKGIAEVDVTYPDDLPAA